MKTTLVSLITAAISARIRRSRLGHTRQGPALVPRGHSTTLFLALLGAGLAGVAQGQVVTEFPILTPFSDPRGIAAGPDGNLWFIEMGANQIGRISTAGVVTEFAIPTTGSSPLNIAAGPDGSLWFTENSANQIGRISTAGVVNEFSIPPGSAPGGIVAGPDGNLWFTENSIHRIVRITTAGVVTGEFSVGTSGAVSSIAAGPDGNLWFAYSVGVGPGFNTHAYVGRITTAGVVIGSFSIGTGLLRGVSSIVAGPDNNVWFTERTGLGTSTTYSIGRITTAGIVTEFTIPTANSNLAQISAGPDGNLWFTEYFANQIGQITTAGVITEFPIPTASSGLSGIAAGPDGNLWFTERYANKIGRITTGSTTPEPMAVDAHGATGSNSGANGVLEPGETVQVAPSWKNTLTIPQTFTGNASSLTGPAGPTYTINDNSADYGTVNAGKTGNCDSATGDCYLMTVSGTRPAAHWDATFAEDLSSNSMTTIRTLHVGESFNDVPTSNPFYGFIENLFHNGVTGGCAGGNYCPTASVTRAQMAVLLLKAKLGASHVPPPATGTVFNDVHVGDFAADWIENLAGLQITGGCGGGNYCPTASVTRAQMAVLLLKAKLGASHVPPPATGTVFNDVHPGDFAADWIESLAGLQITGGCGGGNYCPDSPSTRGQMAVFLVKTFGLELYGK